MMGLQAEWSGFIQTHAITYTAQFVPGLIVLKKFEFEDKELLNVF